MMTVELEKYKNLRGGSGIKSYASGDDFIVVEFREGDYKIYLYNHSNPGADIVERMKELAQKGVGLNSYINRNLRSKTRILYHKKGNSLEAILKSV